jgi:hypothetical protein
MFQDVSLYLRFGVLVRGVRLTPQVIQRPGRWLADVTREEAVAAVGGAMRKRKWCVVCLLVLFQAKLVTTSPPPVRMHHQIAASGWDP